MRAYKLTFSRVEVVGYWLIQFPFAIKDQKDFYLIGEKIEIGKKMVVGEKWGKRIGGRYIYFRGVFRGCILHTYMLTTAGDIYGWWEKTKEEKYGNEVSF